MSSYTVKMFSKSRPIHSNERFGDNQVKDLPSFKDIYWVLSWCEHFANKLFLQFYVSNPEISRVTLKGLKYFLVTSLVNPVLSGSTKRSQKNMLLNQDL